MPKPAVKEKRELPVLSQREVADFKNKIEASEAYIKQLDGTPNDAEGLAAEAHLPARQVIEADPTEHRNQIKRWKKALEMMDPANQRLTGADRQKSEKRYFELKDWLAGRMLSKAQMNYFPSSKDEIKQANYEQAVRRATAPDSEHSNGFIKLAHEFKRLGRLLWPEDPEKCNLEFIRPQGERSSGRHFQV